MSWKDEMMNAMNEESFFDCHLIGSDGVEVPCVKVFLATQSEYFKTLLFGEFKEQESGRCNLNYPSNIIRVVVKFCHSGDMDLNLILDAVGLRETEINRLVELRDAGRYFQLDEVVAGAEKVIGNVVFRNRDVKCACVVLAELISRGEDEGPFWDVFFRYVIENPMPCFCPDYKFQGSTSVASFHPTPHLLARVLEGIDNNNVIVQCIKSWATQETNIYRTSTETEQEPLKAISKRVDLKSLSTLQLSKIQPCSFFPADRILEAFVYHGSLSEDPVPILDLTSVIYVSLAGEEGLEGFYQPHPYRDNHFFKRGEHEGVLCEYEISFNPVDNRWSISVYTEKKLGHSEHLLQARKSSLLYRTSTSSSEDVPFNDWGCLEGTEPAPFVTTLCRWTVHKRCSSFRFGSADTIPNATEHASSGSSFGTSFFAPPFVRTGPSVAGFVFSAAAAAPLPSYSFGN
ncbi:unnamed protein product [Cylindrotheca closterium]|uniref:BTB domain-containing protein n=1 Tax=Cylindrotheca closterium TaxID=2856 RepID=A0AAD2FU41_9STRA|nr:unnamed protein product [Cylindrotheca closterium]